MIVDNIDSFFTHSGDFLIIHDWKRPWRITGNSSVYRFKLGAFPGLMPYFREHFDEIRQKFRNEQAYLSWYVDQEKSSLTGLTVGVKVISIIACKNTFGLF